MPDLDEAPSLVLTMSVDVGLGIFLVGEIEQRQPATTRRAMAAI